MNRIVFLLCILLSISAKAQNKNSIWIFGDSAGVDFANIIIPQPIFSTMDGRGSCSSVSDSIGKLILYSFNVMDGNTTSTFIHNFNNDTIENGNNLYGVGFYNQITIVPSHKNNNQYYIIYSGTISPVGFYFAVVDMSLNNGYGKVVLRDQSLISNIEMGDCTQAIQHGNGRDWWILIKPSISNSSKKNRFYIFLLDTNGFSPYTIQDFNNATDATFQKIIFSNKGNKLMVINFGGFMAEYDFDRCTGIISNEKVIFPEQTIFTRYFWEGAYSPNDSLFYVTAQWTSIQHDTSRVLQYNLFAPNIPASCDTLFEIKYPIIIGAIRLAPDNRIYFTSLYQFGFPSFPFPDSVRNMYNENLSVINYPDSLGTACNLQPFSFYLGGKRTYGGLPNNPNYGLGRLYGSPCDTLQWVGIDTPKPPAGGLNAMVLVSPNPFGGMVNIEINNFVDSDMHLKIVDAMGREVLLQKIISKNTVLDLSKVNAGLYSVMVYDENSIFTCKIIRE